jgi:suppressor of ftsI
MVRRAALFFCCAALLAPAAPLAAQHEHHTGADGRHRMTRDNPMLPGMRGVTPGVGMWLPGRDLDPDTIPAATPRQLIQLADGDTLRLEARFVRRTIGGTNLIMYGFNGQFPGPLLQVPQDATVYIDFANLIDHPSTVHWHGVRLDNRFDGVPDITQPEVRPGESFLYEVHFPDAGIYWYHPHVREDVQQDMGLYGNMLVTPSATDYYGPANHEEVIMLDDIVIEGDTMVHYGLESPNYALMGRFGTTMLVNGEPHYHLQVNRGDVVRFYITNVANTRIFNLSFDNARMKIVGSDIGKFEREQWVESVLISPAERYIVDVLFEETGMQMMRNRVQALDHFMGELYEENWDLGMVEVSSSPTSADHADTFAILRENTDVIADIDQYRNYFDRAPDHELRLNLRAGNLPTPMVAFMSLDTAYFRPLEMNDAMPDMNWITSGRDITWIMRDAATGAENMDIRWQFRQGDIVKIRIVNEGKGESFHPMSHPIHFHGQRLLVLSVDGVANPNLVWKDTILIPVGRTVDLLMEATNPGDWMMHCHVAEHLGVGMMGLFSVEGQG